MQYSTKSIEEEFRPTVKGIVQIAINITPPGIGKRSQQKASEFAAEGLARGKAKIDRDLGGIFVPVDLKGHRTINMAFGKPMATPVTVTTKERYPDVEAIYKRRNGRRHSGSMTRGQKAPYYVSRAKLEALRALLHSHIGHAVGGFSAAAQATGARLPGYGRGKGGAGTGFVTVTEEQLHFHMENLVKYIGDVPDIENKLQYAMEYQTNALLRRIPYVVAAAAKKAGFRTAA